MIKSIGTTAVVAQGLKRNWIIIEKELEYCKLIRERLGRT
jgi:DNA modification methylase